MRRSWSFSGFWFLVLWGRLVQAGERCEYYDTQLLVLETLILFLLTSWNYRLDPSLSQYTQHITKSLAHPIPLLFFTHLSRTPPSPTPLGSRQTDRQTDGVGIIYLSPTYPPPFKQPTRISFYLFIYLFTHSSSLNPPPRHLNPQTPPSNLKPQTSNLNPQPSTLNPQP